MTLKEVSRWSHEYLAADIAKGGKFVVFPYAISIIAVTYKRSSQIYYIPSYRMAITHGWMYLLISIVLGWWGIPWGPIYTIQSIVRAFDGINVTDSVIESLNKNGSLI